MIVRYNRLEASIEDLAVELPGGKTLCTQKVVLPTKMDKNSFDYMIDPALTFQDDYAAYSAAYHSERANGAERITMYLVDSMPEIGIARLKEILFDNETDKTVLIIKTKAAILIETAQ